MSRQSSPPLKLQSCEYCGIGRLCLSADLVGANLQPLKPVVEKRFAVPRRRRLYEVGSPVRAVYVIRSGSFKTCEIDADGDEQVVDFFLPGDVLALEDLSAGQHDADAVALEDAWVCAMPLTRMNEDAMADSVMMREMFAVVCNKLSQQRQMIHRLGKADATTRLCHFLLELSSRLESRQLPADRFRLPMSRADIASYLRTTLETVSRSFGALQQDGLLEVHAKEVTLKNPEGLAARARLG